MAKVITTELQHSGASAANITLDSSKNVTCENNLQVDGNVTVTGTLPADKLTGNLPAISGASLTGISSPAAGRNKIINGGMIINQRGNVTGKTSSSNEYWGPDRYQAKMSSSAAGTWSVSQETDAPEGFSNSLLWHCTSGVTMSGSNNVYFRHKIEAQNLVDWKWGTSNAKDVVLSFYVKSTETGVGTISAFHSDHDTSDANTGYTYTINAANTWERKTIQIAKSTSDAFDVNNSTGLSLYFNLDGGPDLKTGTLNTSWGAWNSANWMVGQTIAIAGTGKKYWITGIQLEEGTTATDFEHRTWHDELLRCQRYYWQFPIDSERGEDLNGILGLGHSVSATELTVPVQNPVYMRVPPTLENVTGMTNTWNSQHGGGNWGTWTMGGTWGTATNNLHSWVKFTGSGATSDESVLIYRSDSATESVVGFDAEL